MIRQADPSRDAAACAAIYAPYVLEGVASLEVQAPDEREMAKRIERISRTHAWLVAELDGAIAGYAYSSRHHERAAYRWSTDVTVYLDAAFQRRGLGRALYSELLELARRQGLYVACAGITLPNAASVGLHEAMGFTPVGVYRGVGFKHGRWWDVGWWQLQLRERSPAGAAPPEPGPPR
ncbi:MAG: N-acetyltransferase [Solirubrobacterales bacterium]|nr:N-acetyltransferase [Solirubrobacterales bacterium]